MLTGAHVILYSTQPERDRAFLRDVLELPHVDVGEGWLIFGLPPAEVAVHPATKNGLHEFYFMCADVAEFVMAMRGHHIHCGPVQDMGWGRLVQITLPGGGKVGVYQPRHAHPPQMQVTPGAQSRSKPDAPKSKARATKKTVRKTTAKNSTAKKAPAKKTAARKTSARKSPAKRATARRGR